MDDVVYRELRILERDCRKMATTIRNLAKGLRNDSRFGTLERVKDMRSDENQEDLIERTGPEGQTEDPFSVPLSRSHD